MRSSPTALRFCGGACRGCRHPQINSTSAAAAAPRHRPQQAPVRPNLVYGTLSQAGLAAPNAPPRRAPPSAPINVTCEPDGPQSAASHNDRNPAATPPSAPPIRPPMSAPIPRWLPRCTSILSIPASSTRRISLESSGLDAGPAGISAHNGGVIPGRNASKQPTVKVPTGGGSIECVPLSSGIAAAPLGRERPDRKQCSTRSWFGEGYAFGSPCFGLTSCASAAATPRPAARPLQCKRHAPSRARGPERRRRPQQARVRRRAVRWSATRQGASATPMLASVPRRPPDLTLAGPRSQMPGPRAPIPACAQESGGWLRRPAFEDQRPTRAHAAAIHRRPCGPACGGMLIARRADRVADRRPRTDARLARPQCPSVRVREPA